MYHRSVRRPTARRSWGLLACCHAASACLGEEAWAEQVFEELKTLFR
ncbi:MAG TPA: hypothetical protein VHG28_24040 [Longimicrobiaceae bacterium]|nr:hypothetical protein [Longimicrobiaceae bacterium]